MACSVFYGSCSLCPWCDDKRCPYFCSYENSSKRYWVYATDRENSCHVFLANFDTKESAITFVKKLINRKWSKNYRTVQYIDRRIIKNNKYNIKRDYIPFVELTITDGEYSWYNAVNLLINTENKTISYHNIWTTKFYPYVDKKEKINIEIIKPWDEKLEFINMKELPWFPTKLKTNK